VHAPRRSRGLLAALAALVLLPGLGRLDLWEPDEPRIAQVAEELRSLEHGRAGLVLLHLNGEPYTEKPPLYYWIAAALGAPAGRVGEWAARLPSAVAGVAAVALTAAFGALLLGPRAGLFGGALLLSTWEFAYLARRAQFDVLLTVFETLALLGFWRLDRGLGSRAANAALFHGAMGLAVLTKGPVGVLVPLLVALAFLAWERRPRAIARALPPWALLLSLAPGLAWLAAAAAAAPSGFVADAVGENVLGRFFSGTSHERPFYYYLYQFPLDALPWSLLWPAVWLAARRDALAPGTAPERRRAWRFLLAWVGASLLFFSFSSGKRGLYLLPAFPAVSLLVADALLALAGAAGERIPRWIARLAGGVGALVVLGAAAAAVSGAAGEVAVPIAFGAAAALAIAAAAAAFRALPREAYARRIGVMVAGVLAVELAVFHVLLPAQQAAKSPRPIAEAAAAATRPGERIGLVGDAQKLAGLAYYGGRRITTLDTPDDVRRFLADGGRVFVGRSRKFDRVEAVTPFEIVATLRGDDREWLVARAPSETAPASAP
jgi:4-amino-4-deoxy-L-arabinose transferase-like glycosyltransferase